MRTSDTTSGALSSIMYGTITPVPEQGVMDAEQVQFGHWLRKQIERERWSQAEFARRMDNMSTGRVSEWLSGKFTPSNKNFERIAKALGMEKDDVMRAAGQLPPDPYAPDPEAPGEIIATMARRIEWDEGRFEGIREMLTVWINQDCRKREVS